MKNHFEITHMTTQVWRFYGEQTLRYGSWNNVPNFETAFPKTN